MNIEEFERIAELMTKHGLTEFSIESEELSLCLKRESPGATTAPSPARIGESGTRSQDPENEHGEHESAPGAENESAGAETENCIISPIVGTFYSAPAPDAPDLVQVGDTVEEDTVVCIVEAMKVMNEIKAGRKGTIARLLVENATPVEYGQPLFALEAV